MPEYDVHIYATVRVKVWNVAGDTPQEAMEKAENSVDLSDLFPDRTSEHRPIDKCVAQSGGYAEEIPEFMLDVVGDEDYEHTKVYDGVTYEEKPPS